ncbi:hypothetical protein [Corynebacterium fournieri]|uniref:hypothetical protein n=1 Tax=Corynebacterium fournieri TaxID=1852390 RepID=UPI000A2F1586|nr:hypothetical protein [Corynebacterium fournieri]
MLAAAVVGSNVAGVDVLVVVLGAVAVEAAGLGDRDVVGQTVFLRGERKILADPAKNALPEDPGAAKAA